MAGAELESDDLRSIIKRGDVEAVDRALQGGVSPEFEFVEENNFLRRLKGESSLLLFAAEVRTSVHFRRNCKVSHLVCLT